MGTRIIQFEIHATNIEQLAKFYRDVFGWEITNYEDFSFVGTESVGSKEPGINGRIVKRQGPAPKGGEAVTAFICTVHVPSVNEYIKKVEAAGGKIALPKMAIPGLAWLAYCKDIEGNIFGIYEDDKNAK